jgi:hypothetical protein
MDFFLTFFAVVAVGFFLKFIWDSYLTDNTEKRWEEYKKGNPIEANFIERNPLKSVPKNLKKNPSNLSDQHPVFIEYFNMLLPNLKPLVTVNDSSRFEFKIPVEVNGKIRGFNHIGILESHEKLELFIFHISSSGKKITTPHFRLTGKESLMTYENNLNFLADKLFSKPEYKSEVFGIKSDSGNRKKKSNTNKSTIKLTYLKEFSSVSNLLKIIKNSIITNPNDLMIIKNEPNELEFTFPIERVNSFWGNCNTVIKQPISKTFKRSPENGRILFFYHITLKIKNKENIIFTSKTERFREDIDANALLLIFSTLIKELDKQDDGLPF